MDAYSSVVYLCYQRSKQKRKERGRNLSMRLADAAVPSDFLNASCKVSNRQQRFLENRLNPGI